MNGLVYLTFNSAKEIRHGKWNSLVDNVSLPIIAHVIDNASTDDTVKLLDDVGIPVHRNEENVGYSAGINQGLRHLLDKGVDEFIFIVNPDVRCPEKWDKKLAEPLASMETCGIIGARLVMPNGEVIHSGGQVTPQQTLRLWPVLYPVTENISIVSKEGLCATHFTHDTANYTKPHWCPWVTFAVVALRVDMIKDIGLLDETYFLYSSDSQYCMRAWYTGWDSWCSPVAFEHGRSASLQQAPSAIQDQGRSDMLRFAHEEESKWLQLLGVGQPKKM